MMIASGEFVGDLFQVPDSWWGFEAFGRDNHPGACVGYVSNGFKATLLKGTDPRSARYGDVQVLVQPSERNRLLKPTSFGIRPKYFSARRLSLLVDEQIGELDTDDLAKMQSELLRLFDGE